MSDEFPIRVPLSPFLTHSTLSDLGDIEGLTLAEDDDEPRHEHITDLDSGLTALMALIPNKWPSSHPAVAEVLDIACQYIKHQKQNERNNIAKWERGIAALTAYAESLEIKCEDLSKDKEDLADELERVKAMQDRNQEAADEDTDVAETNKTTGVKRGREVDEEESGDEKKPKIKS